MTIRTLLILAAITTLLTACGTPEERAHAYVTKAQTLYDAEDYVAAKIEAANAAQIEPKNPQARFILGKN